VSTPSPVSPKRAESAIGWLLGPLYLLAALGGGALVVKAPTVLWVVVLGVMFGVGFLWIAISTFSPAKPDRKCPKCGQLALRRLDPASTEGVVCEQCGWCDEAASSFYMAEEEEAALDQVVLSERQAKRHARV